MTFFGTVDQTRVPHMYRSNHGNFCAKKLGNKTKPSNTAQAIPLIQNDYGNLTSHADVSEGTPDGIETRDMFTKGPFAVRVVRVVQRNISHNLPTAKAILPLRPARGGNSPFRKLPLTPIPERGRPHLSASAYVTRYVFFVFVANRFPL